MMAQPPVTRRVLLAVDAAPGVGSVALVGVGVGLGTVLAARTVAMRPTARSPQTAAPAPDDDPLMRAVVNTLRDAEMPVAALAGVACGAGPGGFTSLRIAAALAKGFAHAGRRPLLAGPSLAWAAAVRAPAAGTWLVALDALRGERYVAVVTVDELPADVASRALPVRTYEYLGVHPDAAVPLLVDARRAHGVLDIDGDVGAAPIAAGAAAIAPTPVDLALWEPAYGRVAEAQARWEVAHGPLPTYPPLTPA